MSTEKVVKPEKLFHRENALPKLPSAIFEQILQFLKNKDLMSCRLVCYKWLCIIDVQVGLGLKLDRKNKANVFASQLIRSCRSLKIYKSAGLLNWYVCFFSPWNLKSVEVLENIRCDNWQLLLTQCKGIQFLTVATYVYQYNKSQKIFSKKENNFDFASKITEKIDHCSLKRLFFKDVFGRGIADYRSVANMLDTIGIAPQLRQIIITSRSATVTISGDEVILKNATLSLMQRNPGINSFGFISFNTSFQEMNLWDKFLEVDRSCLAQISKTSNGWMEVYNRMPSIDTLFCVIFSDESWIAFSILIANIMRESRNLKTLFLTVGSFLLDPWVLNCNQILQGLLNLRELSLRNDYNYPSSPALENLNLLSNCNILLEYLDISLQLTEENLTTILEIPKLAELHIRLQYSAAAFKEQHSVKILNHPKLKLIFWQKEFQEKWNQFNKDDRNWENVKMKPKKVLKIKFVRMPFVLATDDGMFPEKLWKKKFAPTFALFNKERISDSDRAKIQEDYQ